MSTFERTTGLGSAMAILVLATALQAQTTKTTTEAGAVSVTTTEATGVVLYVEGNRLAVKMVPDGDIRVLNVSPSQQFLIDGQNKRLARSQARHGADRHRDHDHPTCDCQDHRRRQRHRLVRVGQHGHPHTRERREPQLHRAGTRTASS